MKFDPNELKIKLFADGADLGGMLEMYEKPYIKGLTTNPTLMKKAGITDYKKFALEVLGTVKIKPISFEVFSDDTEEMIRQGLEIASWGENVYVKIPITNTLGLTTSTVVKELTSRGCKVNITAITFTNQVKEIIEFINPSVHSYLSIFAGRIADTGRDPVEIVRESISTIRGRSNLEIIWASPRELYNIFQAEEIGCHIITATSEILNKLNLVGKDLAEYSLDTVKMFANDAVLSGYKI
jgi:transaldolase